MLANIFTERPISGPSNTPSNLGPVATWIKVGDALSYTTFQTAATSKSNTLFSLIAGGIISGIKIKHSTAFAGTLITAVTMEVGVVGITDEYSSPAFDVFQVVSATAFGLYNSVGSESATAATNILITARSTGANLSALSAGVVDVWALLSKAV